MLRHVIAPPSGWTKAPHTVVRDRRLNSDAKILLLYVQGLPASATDRPLSDLARKLDMKGRPYQRAKRQLVEHGYVHEWRSQSDGGRWRTDQLFTNTPLTSAEARIVRAALEPDDGGRPPEFVAAPPPPSTRYPTVGAPTPRTAGGYEPEEDHSDKTTPHPPPEAEPPQERAEVPAPDPDEAAPAPHPTSQLAKAERLLLSLRHTRRDLLLGVREARALAVEAVKWLEGGLPEGDLRQALLADPPENGVRSAAGFLRHRLIQKCPVTPLPAPPPAPPVRELIVCTGPGEEHVFRPLGDETECVDCRRAAAYASWTVDTDTYDFPADMPWRQRVAAVRKADALRAAHSSQGDAGHDGQMVAAGGGQGADVAHGG
ncbi:MULTISPECIES: hypothetical protein [Streptomyces]|uniref:hypothetical protein n=1 Tax=Streptomyces TaxID=1883 RepID=UPI000FB25CF7|nr:MULTISPECIES: hypothetical protein [Streptomyces]RPK83192.1 hypothetical protein EES46_25695 [Streptomyces sp. ADI98-10]